MTIDLRPYYWTFKEKDVKTLRRKTLRIRRINLNVLRLNIYLSSNMTYD